MSALPEVIEILRQWVRKAEHDLEAVRRISDTEPTLSQLPLP
jgi:hypothetical protein